MLKANAGVARGPVHRRLHWKPHESTRNWSAVIWQIDAGTRKRSSVGRRMHWSGDDRPHAKTQIHWSLELNVPRHFSDFTASGWIIYSKGSCEYLDNFRVAAILAAPPADWKVACIDRSPPKYWPLSRPKWDVLKLTTLTTSCPLC